jgi:K+-transporting ATPase c subunit
MHANINTIRSKSESDALVADLQKRVEALERRYGGPSREASSDAASDSSSGSQPAITPGAADLRHVTSVLQPRISAEEV